MANFDCILNCDRESLSPCLPDSEAYLHLPIVTSKFDRFSLLSNLSSAVDFAKLNLSKGKTLLICCRNGEDISVCVCLAILTSLYNDEDGVKLSFAKLLPCEPLKELSEVADPMFMVNGQLLMGHCSLRKHLEQMAS
ncbi:hypothetical protein CJ030_MR5G018765 [Morella rubra]|uniref:Rit1 DUSP-like domain-containing protein n=1 Tax=Morella rubra TaxID=262757 RepID=A0A6A1VQB4_9ROSI|nr:hypothetical protein CJ030_MR5G018780 [Morella rubra]KAB1214845.1 hypothetical protein CJ030_MR5G018765 [Morella rubra]